MLYPDNIEQLLGFDKIKARLLKYTLCVEGHIQLSEQSYFKDEASLMTELKAVSESRKVLESGDSFSTMPFVPFKDVLATLKFEGSTLTIDQLLRAHHVIKGIYELQAFFSKKERSEIYPILATLFTSFSVEKKWYQNIEKILDLDKEEIKSSASEELIKIRSKLSKLDRNSEKVFNSELKNYAQKGWLADQKESWRSNRRVLAVQSEFKRQVAGLVLDVSGNGIVTFMEPAALQPIAAEISEWQVKEKKEIERILRNITAELYPLRNDFKQYHVAIAQFDVWQAKANLSMALLGVQPTIDPTEISLSQARHPVLESHLKEVKRAIIPLDVKLSDQNRILVISGPNAGGKSVAMKTVGVLQLMMQFGLHIPADEGAKMKFFKIILADIGDDQSIEDDLSTYSSHLVKMTEFVKVANKDTLFLIDEMGSGTDPALGGPIAEAILDHFGKQKAYGIVTTHYSNLKDKAQVTEGLQNAAMSFEMNKLQPTYELHIGQAGASYAFEVAQRSGLPATILEAAKTLLGSKKSTAEQSLSQIQNEKQYLKGIRKNNQRQSEHLEKLIANYEGLKSRLEKQKKKLMVEFEEKLLADYNEANRELENYIRTQKEKGRDREVLKTLRKDIDDKRQALAKKINKADRKPIQENKSPIKVGSEVKLEDSPRIGKVIEIRKNKAIVLFGNISSTISIDRLIHCVNDDQPETSTTNKSPNKLVEKSQFVDVLDIRGKYKEEALNALDQFMDQAVVFGVDKVKIIHGKGSGVLKDFVQQYLKDYPFVSRFEYETDPSGGKGVTLVEIA